MIKVWVVEGQEGGTITRIFSNADAALRYVMDIIWCRYPEKKLSEDELRHMAQDYVTGYTVVEEY